MENKIILGVDPSLSSTGYAILSKDKIYGCNKINTPSSYDTDTRIQNILHTLDTIIKSMDINIDCVIMEDGFIGFSGKTSLQLAQLRGAIIAFFKWHNIPVIHQQPASIRKHFGLQGNASKEEVADEVLRRFPEIKMQIGPYSDKSNKKKTSDIYDAISIGLSYFSQ